MYSMTDVTKKIIDETAGRADYAARGQSERIRRALEEYCTRYEINFTAAVKPLIWLDTDDVAACVAEFMEDTDIENEEEEKEQVEFIMQYTCAIDNIVILGKVY